MLFKNVYATAAMVFCLSAMPVVTHAQTAAAGGENDAIFVPMVDECVVIPTADTCARVRAVITECADGLERALCDVLFAEPSAVFDTPQMYARAQILLSDTRDAIADMVFDDVNDPAIDWIIAEGRADAERTMLRGDANPMSHSGPPSVVTD